VSFTGSELSGVCEGCTYAFDVEAEITEDNSTGDCTPSPYYTYIPNEIIKNPVWAFFPEYEEVFYYYGYGYYYYTYTDVVATGVSVDYTGYGYGYYEGPYFSKIAYSPSYYSSATVSGNTISWTIDYYVSSYYYTQAYYYGYAYGYGYSQSYPYGTNYGGESYLGEIDLYGYYMDGWELDLDSGDMLYISADTYSADSACDLRYFVNSPSGTTVLFADDSFACTYDPTSYYCPSGYINAPEDGTYQIWVLTWGYCAGDENRYNLLLERDDGDEPDATLEYPYTFRYWTIPYTYDFQVSGTATISE
jgi:hypothetical protein